MIVIEGVDAAGKSTLANYLARVLHAPIQVSGGPPRHRGDTTERCERYAKLSPNTIFDRHPAISEPIYSSVLGREIDLDYEQVDAFYASNPLIIYCDGSDEIEDHEVKAHEETQHVKKVRDHYVALLDAYRNWAIVYAHIIYRIGDSMERIERMVSAFDPVGDIDQFHSHFQIKYDSIPRDLPEDLMEFRLKFLAEELCEYAGVPDLTKKLIQSALLSHKTTNSLELKFDALVDLVYVALGTSQFHGFDFREGWRRVHAANMTKRRIQQGDKGRHMVYDVIKPESFVPPDLSDLCRG